MGDFNLALNNSYFDNDINEYSADDVDYNVKSIVEGDLSGIFGIPYQFLDTVDPRVGNSEIGVKYSDKILSKMPLLFLTPCRQVFMPEASAETRESTLSQLLGGAGIKDGASEVCKYYTTESAYDKYYLYVNKMCQQMCKFSGKGDEKVQIGRNKIQKLKNVDWYHIKNSSFENYFNANQAVVFYLDGFNSRTDSFSNSSMESSLANTVNGFSDQAKEIRFLLGPDSALTNMMESAGNITSGIMDTLGGTIGDLAGGMLGNLASKGVNTIVQGGKIIFPKIWQDFSYDRQSFNFTVKLRSPDNDTLSIILNVIIPYLHSLGFVLPIGVVDDPNGFISPFLVKAYSKGMFNIDMGLITGLTATVGAECQWNDDGLPTQIDLDFTIEDLYSSLFMTPLGSDGTRPLDDYLHVVRNTAMMDFLSNLAGLNIADVEPARQSLMALYLAEPTAAQFLSNKWNAFDTGVANFISKLYTKIGI